MFVTSDWGDVSNGGDIRSISTDDLGPHRTHVVVCVPECPGAILESPGAVPECGRYCAVFGSRALREDSVWWALLQGGYYAGLVYGHAEL